MIVYEIKKLYNISHKIITKINNILMLIIILSRVKDGAIVPGQVGLSGLSTLVRGPYPH